MDRHYLQAIREYTKSLADIAAIRDAETLITAAKESYRKQGYQLARQQLVANLGENLEDAEAWRMLGCAEHATETNKVTGNKKHRQSNSVTAIAKKAEPCRLQAGTARIVEESSNYRNCDVMYD